ncbi:hypothetical protein KI387_022185, partial [Taxus chinensis]
MKRLKKLPPNSKQANNLATSKQLENSMAEKSLMPQKKSKPVEMAPLKEQKKVKAAQISTKNNNNQKKKNKQTNVKQLQKKKKQKKGICDFVNVSTMSSESEDYTSGTSDKDSDDDSAEGADSPINDQEVVYADFEFFDPKQDDFHGVRSLLKTYCDGIDWDLSGFVDMILAQTTVGTVIKTDEDSLFGVITAINLARYKDQRCIMELWKFLLDKCLQNFNIIELKTFWEKNPHDVGLLVCERVVNLPFELVPPLYNALFDEVTWATEDEPTEALRDSFKFKHYLLNTKVYQTIQDMQRECKETKKENKKRKKGSSQNGGSGQLIYIKPEDEIFHELSSWSFTFPVHAEYQTTHE